MNIKLGQPDISYKENILNVDLPDFLEDPIPTGHRYIDMLFSGTGIMASTACLITGVPGAGKTTLMLQLADSITRTGNIALYNSAEESVFQIRRVVKRLALQNGFIPSYHEYVDQMIDHADKLQEENPDKTVFLFVDSLQTARVRREKGKVGRPIAKQNMEIKAVEKLTHWAKETANIVFIIGQVNKNGDFSGKQTIKHVVDCHFHMTIDTDRRSETYRERIAEMSKNRFGVAGIFYPFDVYENGIKFFNAGS